MNDQTTLGGTAEKRDPSTDRYDALLLALRTPNLMSYQEVIDAAKAYEAYINGK